MPFRATKKALCWQDFELPQLTTAVAVCKNVENIFISQKNSVNPKLKHNNEQMLRQYSSSPNNAKPNPADLSLKLNLLLMHFYIHKVF